MSTVCQVEKTTGSLAWFPLSVREVDGPPAAGWPLSASGSGSGKPDAPKCHTEWGPF